MDDADIGLPVGRWGLVGACWGALMSGRVGACARRFTAGLDEPPAAVIMRALG